MDNYFDFFPKIYYDLFKDNNPQYVLDLTRRFKVREVVISRAINFYDYIIKEEERPDIIAEKEWGNSKLDWLVLMINQVFDPVWEWPMGYYDFREYLKGKYGSYEIATQTLHHYEKIVQQQEYLTNGVRIPERVIRVDSNTFHMLPETDRKEISCYNWENNLNESRRKIKLLDRDFISQIISEAKVVLGA